MYEIAASKNATLTMQLSEDYMSGIGPAIRDLITDKQIRIHPKTNELYGIHEYVVTSKDQLMELCALVEEKRTTRATGMNHTSSRSHLLIELKMYEKHGDKVQINSFKCMDMAGSERLSKTGLDP